jgi:hypothetical protein
MWFLRSKPRSNDARSYWSSRDRHWRLPGAGLQFFREVVYARLCMLAVICFTDAKYYSNKIWLLRMITPFIMRILTRHEAADTLQP